MPSHLATYLLRTALACWLLVIASGTGTSAQAQGSGSAPPADARAQARVLGERGVDAYNRGDFAAAIETFRRAVNLFDYPTLWLYLARSLERTGRVVEATKAYGALLASPVHPNEGTVEAGARRSARRELRAVAARRATLTLVAGAAPMDVAVEVNGRRWPDEQLDRPTFIDPGSYAIRLTRADRLLGEWRLRVEAGSHHSVPLLAAAATPPPPAPVPPIAAAEPGSPGWGLPLTVSALATGVFAVGAVVTGVLSLDRQAVFDDLNQAETPFERRSTAHARAQRMQLLNAVCIGGAVLGGGTTFFLLINDEPAPATANTHHRSRAASSLSALHIGLVGRF